VTDLANAIAVGKIYRLKFPGVAARVIASLPADRPSSYPYLIESLFVRSRWWVNERGEPDNIYSPMLVTRAQIEGRAGLTG
jgi:hypothetical protein